MTSLIRTYIFMGMNIAIMPSNALNDENKMCDTHT